MLDLDQEGVWQGPWSFSSPTTNISSVMLDLSASFPPSLHSVLLEHLSAIRAEWMAMHFPPRPSSPLLHGWFQYSLSVEAFFVSLTCLLLSPPLPFPLLLQSPSQEGSRFSFQDHIQFYLFRWMPLANVECVLWDTVQLLVPSYSPQQQQEQDEDDEGEDEEEGGRRGRRKMDRVESRSVVAVLTHASLTLYPTTHLSEKVADKRDAFSLLAFALSSLPLLTVNLKEELGAVLTLDAFARQSGQSGQDTLASLLPLLPPSSLFLSLPSSSSSPLILNMNSYGQMEDWLTALLTLQAFEGSGEEEEGGGELSFLSVPSPPSSPLRSSSSSSFLRQHSSPHLGSDSKIGSDHQSQSQSWDRGVLNDASLIEGEEEEEEERDREDDDEDEEDEEDDDDDAIVIPFQGSLSARLFVSRKRLEKERAELLAKRSLTPPPSSSPFSSRSSSSSPLSSPLQLMKSLKKGRGSREQSQSLDIQPSSPFSFPSSSLPFSSTRTGRLNSVSLSNTSEGSSSSSSSSFTAFTAFTAFTVACSVAGL